MGINLGQTPTKAVYLGQTAVKSVFFGSQQVWGGEEPVPVTGDWLCFTAEQNGSKLRLDKVGSPGAISLETSDDGGVAWKDYSWSGDTGVEFTNLNAGDKVYFRAKTENQTIGSSDSNYYKFVMSGKIAASGNIQTLLKADGSRTDAPAYCYNHMFINCLSLTAAPELPATTLANSCYREMFLGCSYLTTGPALPATTLANRCYLGMLSYCLRLTTAPELPATTLADSCYYSMFSGCTALTTAPELPATTLASSCYGSMFSGCTSLSSVAVQFTTWQYWTTNSWLTNVAPAGTFTCPAELPDTRGASNIPTGWQVVNPVEPLCFTAEQTNSTVGLNKAGSPDAVSLETSTDGTTWADYSWNGTTGDTITLANVGDKVYFRAKNENQTIGSSNSNYYKFVMTGKIAASGDIQTLLKADGSRTDAPAYCYQNMFFGCSSLTTAPALPATTLANSCYYNMFFGCSSLTTAPALPATTLANNCYNSMFYGCSSLTTAPALPATTLAEGCYSSMFLGCSSLTTAPVLSATTIASYSCQEMFRNCKSLTTAPELPAATLASNCYLGMFNGCTSLTTAPALPATTLGSFCYQYMFYNCSSLSSVEVAFTAWSSNATGNWLDGVAASGTFTCPAQLPDERGTNRIPEGWTKVAPVTGDWLCFTATQANSSIRMNKVGSAPAVFLEYSTDGATWSDYTWSGSSGIQVPLATVGAKAYFRAKNDNTHFDSTTDNIHNYNNFVGTGKFSVSGNIMTLLKGDGSLVDFPEGNTDYNYAFGLLFDSCASIDDASQLKLPSSRVPAHAYDNMFWGCSSLTSAPELPATTLAERCYESMFSRCTSLTTAPELPATTLVSNCYRRMFFGCTALNSIEAHFTDWGYNTTENWLDGVAASGTFTCPAELPDTRDESHIPTGWTKTDAA